MSVRSAHSISSSVLKNLKVFRTFCSAILQYFVKFIFVNCHKQQHFAVFIFFELWANSHKKNSTKTNTAQISSRKTNSLEVDAQVSYSVSDLKLKTSHMI